MVILRLDPEEIRELEQIAELSRDSPAEAAVALTFTRSENYPTPYRPGRFGNGQWPVLYTSLERETSEQEMQHYVGMGQFKLDGEEMVWDVLEIQFDGQVHDLRPLVPTIPALIDPNPSSWQQCHPFAEAALSAEVQGLISKSARRTHGDTLPVLSKSATSTPRRIGETYYRYDGEADTVSISRRTSR